MQLVVGFCRYALPLLAFIILFKCMLTLLIGHPVNKTYGYIVNSINGEKIPLNTWETSIGRSKSCDITLVYSTVSRFHAAICRRVDGWYIFDTNSKLGTFVNGEKIEGEATVKNSDIITFGDCNFQFVITDDPVIQVGKKRRGRKNQYTEPKNSDNINTDSYAQPHSFNEPAQPQPEAQRYDDFDSIRIDFHPKNSQSDEKFKGRIKDVYSDEGGYAGEYKPQTERDERKNAEKQAAIINPESGETFLLCANRITLGRSRNSDIRLGAQNISRNHALLVKKQNRWYISDAGSTYGTFVGKNKITSAVPLYDGDIISLSDKKLKFVEDYR